MIRRWEVTGPADTAAEPLRTVAMASDRHPILENFNVFDRFSIHERDRPARRDAFRDMMTRCAGASADRLGRCRGPQPARRKRLGRTPLPLLINPSTPVRRRDRSQRRGIDGLETPTYPPRLRTEPTTMRITLVGSRHFGVTTLNMLRQHGVDIVRVVVADAEDRLAAAARAAGIEVVVQANPKLVVAKEIAGDTDLIVTAHSHARIAKEALATARLGGIGYHPSLLPRHRGIAAVEWTIKEGDPIAGGTIYHLADRMDAGAIAAQEWCFVKKGETARELWERALAPLGQKLLGEVIDYAKVHNSLPAKPQDEKFATLAPSLLRVK
jgi:methionyl-tRNA formyltransferase